MKDPRIEKLVSELRYTVDRLNRLSSILDRAGVEYKLSKSSTKVFEIHDLVQKVKYDD